jgi:hypothetical protein
MKKPIQNIIKQIDNQTQIYKYASLHKETLYIYMAIHTVTSNSLQRYYKVTIL